MKLIKCNTLAVYCTAILGILAVAQLAISKNKDSVPHESPCYQTETALGGGDSG